jgi:preprotein translocase subunit SecA
VAQYVPQDSLEEQWDIKGLEQLLMQDWHMPMDLHSRLMASDNVGDEEVLEWVLHEAHGRFEAKLAQVGMAQFTPFMRVVLLQSIDTHWRDHLSALDYLRQGIHLRGYAQKQPKQEYKREAFELFAQLLDSVKHEVTKTLMTVQIQSQDQLDEAAQSMEQKAEHMENVTYSAPDESGDAQVLTAPQQPPVPSVGRNEPCPCGSGRKYKHCHGQLK